MSGPPGRLTEIRVEPGPLDQHPFTLPVVRGLVTGGGLRLPPGATFLTGENGSGKSTLLEAVAVAGGLNPEGGSRSMRFSTRPTDFPLAERLVLRRSAGAPRNGWFLRSEALFTLATEIERLEAEQPGLLRSYGGRTLHERSHGESLLDVLRHRVRGPGLYLLDEPEAGLSPGGGLAALRLLHDLVRSGAQLLVATHSPILLALPGARILQIEPDGALRPVAYDEAEVVVRTRDFLAAPERTLRVLLADP